MSSDSPHRTAATKIAEVLKQYQDGNFEDRLELSGDANLDLIIKNINDLGRSMKAQFDHLIEGHEHLQRTYEETIAALPVGLASLDEERHFVVSNPALTQILGYSQEELRKLTIIDITHPDDVDVSTHAANQAFHSNRTTVVHEKRYIHKNGQIVWTRITARRVKTSLGYRLVGIVEDITQRKLAEKRLQEKTQELQKMINGVPTPIAHWDAELKNLAANTAYTQMLGITPQELLGRKYSDTVELRFPQVKRYMLKALEGEKSTIQSTVPAKDGKDRHFQVTYQPDVEDGKIVGVFVVATEVTSQRAAEIESSRVASFLELVLRNIPSTIFVKDCKNDFRYSLLNAAGEALLGLKPQQFIGKTDFEIMTKEQAEVLRRTDMEIVDQRKLGVTKGLIIASPEGNKIVDAVKLPIFDAEGNVEYLLGIARDVTEEIRMQELIEQERTKSLQIAKLASLGEMAAGIAHEINNPLAIIMGSLAIAEKSINDPEVVKAKLEVIQRSSARIQKIVAGLKKFSRTSEVRELHKLSLSRIIKEAVILTDPKSRRHSTPIIVDCKADGVVNCDEIEIEQILVNLINNSIDAVGNQPDKWVRVTLFEEPTEVVLQVRDSGPGIPAEIKNKIFQPFYTTKPVGQGTGLGLSIVKGILDRHGAAIAILEQETNTCFEIRFQKEIAVSA